MEKAKEVVGTIDRVHELRLQIPGVVADLQIATVLALREMLFVANFNDVLHFFALSVCIYKTWTNKFSLSTIPLVASGFSGTGPESVVVSFDRIRSVFVRSGRWGVKEC
jgi:hypothetical protein